MGATGAGQQVHNSNVQTTPGQERTTRVRMTAFAQTGTLAVLEGEPALAGLLEAEREGITGMEMALACVEEARRDPDGTQVVLAARGEEIVGMMAWRNHQGGDRSQYELTFLGCLTEGQGAGSALLGYLAARAKAMGAAGVQAMDRCGQEGFYESCGFDAAKGGQRRLHGEGLRDLMGDFLDAELDTARVHAKATWRLGARREPELIMDSFL